MSGRARDAELSPLPVAQNSLLPSAVIVGGVRRERRDPHGEQRGVGDERRHAAGGADHAGDDARDGEEHDRPASVHDSTVPAIRPDRRNR